MNPNIVVHLLIVLIIGGVLIIFIEQIKFFYSCFTYIIINSLLIPEFLIPLELWEYLLKN